MVITKTDDRAILPKRATDGAAGFDLHAITASTIDPGGRSLIKTGLSIEIGHGKVGLVCSRSGLAFKHGVCVLNAPGVIDSDYRGEIGVILFNAGSESFTVNVGDRVAQLLLLQDLGWSASLTLVSKLGDTARASGGFGSTGV